ncbi:hypothetical protein L0U85_09130 [Glycomyces sp. L485]|nr:hypothetical protein [Glycomyces sp. L485]
MTLKNALETLLGKPCHHMAEVFGRVDVDVPGFSAAARGDHPDWDELLKGYGAAVDWPAAAFYSELADHYPDAIVVLSRRDSFESWWTSASNTVFKKFNEIDDPSGGPWLAMVRDVWDYTFEGAPIEDRDAVEAAYHRYHEKVRETIPAERLVEFETGAGWEPLCAALGLPIPEEPFPHLNSTKEFHDRIADIQQGDQ